MTESFREVRRRKREQLVARAARPIPGFALDILLRQKALRSAIQTKRRVF